MRKFFAVLFLNVVCTSLIFAKDINVYGDLSKGVQYVPLDDKDNSQKSKTSEKLTASNLLKNEIADKQGLTLSESASNTPATPMTPTSTVLETSTASIKPICEQGINCFNGMNCCANGYCQADCSVNVGVAPSTAPVNGCAAIGGSGEWGKNNCYACDPADHTLCAKGNWNCFYCEAQVPAPSSASTCENNPTCAIGTLNCQLCPSTCSAPPAAESCPAGQYPCGPCPLVIPAPGGVYCGCAKAANMCVAGQWTPTLTTCCAASAAGCN